MLITAKKCVDDQIKLRSFWPLLVVGFAIIESVDELSDPHLAVRGGISGRAQR